MLRNRSRSHTHTLTGADARRETVVQKYPGSANFSHLIRGSLSPCGRFVFMGSEDGFAHVWSAESGSSLLPPDLPFDFGSLERELRVSDREREKLLKAGAFSLTCLGLMRLLSSLNPLSRSLARQSVPSCLVFT